MDYTRQSIDPNILSVLDVNTTGKVVSAKDWRELWGLVIKHINTIDEYCISIEDIRVNWETSEAELNKVIAEFRAKYDTLSKSFIHYGEEPPEDEHTKLWIQPVEDVSGDSFITYKDLAAGLSTKVDAVDGKQLSTNDYTDDDKTKLMYMPTNLRNGSRTGSIRTIGSSKEDISYTLGQFASAEGSNTKASGGGSHAEGLNTNASGNNSHAEGSGTTASGFRAHAEGCDTTASGESSHAEGCETQAIAEYSHAEGYGTKALGDTSHAEGMYTTALGGYSHAEGNSTLASSGNQHVQGKYNIADTNNSYADIIGNGSSNTKRSNAATVDWNGNAWYAGDVYVGSTSGTNRDEGSKKLATEAYVDTQIISNIDQTYSPTSANAQSGKAVAEAVSTEKARADNTFANALENKKSGITLMIDDISPISNKLKVKSTIESVQEGEGEPSFNNIRPIQGWDSVTLALENGIQADTRNYTCAFPETVYGGTLDWESGVLTVDWINVLLNGTEPFNICEEYDNGFIRFWWTTAHTAGSPQEDKILSDRFKTGRYTNDNAVFLTGGETSGLLNIVINTEYIGGNTVDDFIAYLAAQYAAGTPVQVCYKLGSKYKYNIQLNPQQITTLSGANTLYSDSGTTEVVYNRDINKAFAELQAAIISLGGTI